VDEHLVETDIVDLIMMEELQESLREVLVEGDNHAVRRTFKTG